MFKRLREIIILLILAYVALYFINSEITDVINAQILALFKPKTENTVTENQVNQLSENELTDAKTFTSLAEASQDADRVQKLDLSGQNLVAMPAEIFTMKKLQFLNLSNNKITVIPDEIQNLEQLQVLELANNQINTISTKIDDLSFLQKLNLANNQLADLPDVFSNLGKLAELDLSGNANLNLKKAMNDLGYSRNLKKLVLKNQSVEAQKEIIALKKLLPDVVVE
jgi:Leucine-rich repeat (LRR) protein